MRMISVALVSFLVCVISVNAQTCPELPCDLGSAFGDAQPWSLIVIDGNLTLAPFTDIGGRALINGSADIGSAIGDALFDSEFFGQITCDQIEQAGCPSIALAVNGQLLWHQGQIWSGNVLVSDETPNELPLGTSLAPTCDIQELPPASILTETNFDSAVLSILDYTEDQCATDGNPGELIGSTLYLVGSGPAGAAEKFTVTSDELDDIKTIWLVGTINPSSVVITVRGSPIFLGNAGLLGQWTELSDRIAWVFCDATYASFNSIGLFGTIVAPFTDVVATSGQILGNFYVRSLTGSFQINYMPSTICAVAAPTPAPTPEPTPAPTPEPTPEPTPAPPCCGRFETRTCVPLTNMATKEKLFKQNNKTLSKRQGAEIGCACVQSSPTAPVCNTVMCSLTATNVPCTSSNFASAVCYSGPEGIASISCVDGDLTDTICDSGECDSTTGLCVPVKSIKPNKFAKRMSRA